LPKLSDINPKVAGKIPAPVKVAVWGEFEALSVTLSVPLSAPRTLGVKVTLIVQKLRAATLPWQVSVSV
jgi:hypothetical protein